ncbi:MAG: Lrp/AsnC family transcriptional regulator [Rhodospirillaceae bacterium]|nr:Lrp/AsnC family transcriptional regulator [Rhodospirillaceae bacterium]MBT6087037.1 Lrp/AsnC family transcriptional regulator [Rhodospirillaceae bacterium]MBT6607298.1 Lrp/AsnC family transcriptional regulator [Rhodospirillaceae bacterium]MBT7249839.1 Lrp/AsnC family transcriptional regulator [Rhodospirillaceae bacterium]MBT7510284.1 Lrp/AsnC family transcriptional regulator [Rhodospirillaceae bacterium]
MDRLDHKILACLQEDAGLSVAEIGERVGLSSTPCWRRIRNLEDAGIIERRVALLNRTRLGLDTTVFVAVKTSQHTEDWLQHFADVVAAFPEIVEFYRMSGDVDYLMKVVVADIPAFDAFYKRLIAAVDLSDVSSSFAMEEIKFTTALPLGSA